LYTFVNVIFDSKNSKLGVREYGNFINCVFSGTWALDGGKTGTLVGLLKNCTFNSAPERFYFDTFTSKIENSIINTNINSIEFTGELKDSIVTFLGATNGQFQIWPTTLNAKINNLTLNNASIDVFANNLEIVNSVIKPLIPSTQYAIKGDAARQAAISNCSTTATTPLFNVTKVGLQSI
jgi:hypothetical protein